MQISEPRVALDETGCTSTIYVVTARNPDGTRGDIFNAKSHNLAALGAFTRREGAEDHLELIGNAPEPWLPSWEVSTIDADAFKRRMRERFGPMSIDVVTVDGVAIPLTKRAARRLVSLSGSEGPAGGAWKAMGRLGPKLVTRAAIEWFEKAVLAASDDAPRCACC